MKKVSIIGAGNVGTSAALYIAEKQLANIQLVDIKENLAKGKAIDLMDAAPLREYDIQISGSSDFMDLMYSDVVVVTAGKVRTPGMKREDLLFDNGEIINSLAQVIKKAAPNAVVIVVTEPVDAMTYLLLKKTKFPPSRVMGLTGVLDVARFKYFVSEELNICALDIDAVVIGGHHEYMVPLVDYCKIGGIPLREILPQKKIDEIIDKVKRAGAEIVKNLKEGSSFYAPGACVSEMVESIIRNKRKIHCVTTLIQDKYGLKDICLGAPVILGKNGIEKILELKLSSMDRERLLKSAEVVSDSQKSILRIENMSRALDLL